jgi:hypothetical protein
MQGAAFHLTGAKNPFIDFETLAAMEAEVDPKTAARDVHGQLGIPTGDTVLYTWTSENVRSPWPELIDITPEVAKRELGKAAGYIVGVDLQASPGCVAAVCKVFRDPARPQDEIGVVVDEFMGDDEDDLMNEIEASPRWQRAGRIDGENYRGWREALDSGESPAHCAAVLDASSAWQDAEHRPGKTSEQMFIARRWREVYPPQKDSKRNPDLVARFKVANSRICTSRGVRRLYVHPECLETIEALAKYENKNGAPNRRSKYAHRADAVSYVTFRLWGTVKLEKKRGHIEYRGVGTFPDFRGW